MDSSGNPVAPLKFEGKTQADVVREIIEAFGSYDVVFFISPTGTGKSAIAMNVIANAFSAGIIVVPTKHLQKQYYNDFNPETGRFKIPGIDIRFILGRNNFTCPKYNIECSSNLLPCTRKLAKYEPRYEVAGKCFTPDTFVLTPKGIKKITELRTGDEVYCLDVFPTEKVQGKKKDFGVPLKGSEKIVIGKVKKVRKRYYKGEVVELFNNHFSIKVTPEHRVLHKRSYGSKVIWECSAEFLLNNFTKSIWLLTGKEEKTNVKVRKQEYEGYVYDVEVEPYHNLLVSNNRFFFICLSNCPYWCPRYPNKESLINKVQKATGKIPIKYRTAGGEYVIFMGDDPEEDCPYLRQYRAYVEANVIVMNDKLWLIETLARRKPIWIGGVEVWDEGDNLIQQLTTATTVSEKRFKRFFDDSMLNAWNKIMSIAKGDVLRDFIFSFLQSLEKKINSVASDEESEALLWKLRKIIDEYDDYVIRIEPKEKKIYFFYKNVAEYIRKILRLSNQKILIMSATLQDKKVLEEYYGFDNYTIIYGKTKYPGKIYLLKTKRWWVTHRNWEIIERKMINEAKKVIKEAEKHKLKTLIQAHAFKYVEKLDIPIDSSEKDYFEDWINGKILTLASTRLKRGADLKDDLCRCMIITKMPYPDKEDVRIKHMFEVLPEELAHAVYKDMARRELIQQIGRGLRHDNDWMILAVLDRIALEELKQLNLWEMEEVGSIGEVVKAHK